MINSYNCGETKKVYRRRFSKKFPPEIQGRARQKFFMLNAAADIEDLKGDREGQHSVRINQKWRVCFEWREGNAYNVEIVDYH